jgi:hypothetical protein
MQSISWTRNATVLTALACLTCAHTAHAQTYFTSQSAFSAAAGGPGALTVFHFDGLTETQGKAANDITILPSYSSQGVDFLPFLNTTIYPTIARNQQFQISVPGRDGLLNNSSATAPTTDLDARAIRFQFNRPETTVGVYFNGPLFGGDGGYLQAYDSANNLLGQTPVSDAGGFVGLVSNTPIDRVNIVNTFNSDITFGIFDLQFSNRISAANTPEPGTYALFISLGLASTPFLRRIRRFRRTF